MTPECNKIDRNSKGSELYKTPSAFYTNVASSQIGNVALK